MKLQMFRSSIVNITVKSLVRRESGVPTLLLVYGHQMFPKELWEWGQVEGLSIAHSGDPPSLFVQWSR